MGADSALKDAVYDRCEKDVGMGFCQYVDFCVYASSLPLLYKFFFLSVVCVVFLRIHTYMQIHKLQKVF